MTWFSVRVVVAVVALIWMLGLTKMVVDLSSKISRVENECANDVTSSNLRLRRDLSSSPVSVLVSWIWTLSIFVSTIGIIFPFAVRSFLLALSDVFYGWHYSLRTRSWTYECDELYAAMRDSSTLKESEDPDGTKRGRFKRTLALMTRAMARDIESPKPKKAGMAFLFSRKMAEIMREEDSDDNTPPAMPKGPPPSEGETVVKKTE